MASGESAAARSQDATSAAALSRIKDQLKKAVGNPARIRAVADAADRELAGDAQRLCEVYALAMRVFGPFSSQVASSDFDEICVRRLTALCRCDLEEASVFHQFMCMKRIRPEVASAIIRSAGLANQARTDQVQSQAGQPQLAPERRAPIKPRTLRYSGVTDDNIASKLVVHEQAPLRTSSFDDTPEQEAVSRVVHSVPAGREMSTQMVMSTSQLPVLSTTDPQAVEPCGVPYRVPAQLPLQPQPVPQEIGQLCDIGVKSTQETPLWSAGDLVDTRQHKIIMVNGKRYLRIREIGRGGSSKVYEVQSEDGQIFALKRVEADDSKHFDDMANEVLLLRQLKERSVSSVVDVYDAEIDRERKILMILMEKGEKDLGRILHSEPNLTIGDIQAMWRQMLEAVQAIHNERIVHSDLKPANFLLVDGKLKLIDFGIAKRIANETTHICRDSQMGTISYMAPEAVNPNGGIKLGRATDIWSLGIILYQMVYGKVPFGHLKPLQRLQELAKPNVCVDFPLEHNFQGHSEGTKAHLDEVLRECLRHSPALRPQIPDLLNHAFLRTLKDTAMVTRSSFDRAVEVLASSFYAAAHETLCGEDGLDENGAPACAWQPIADELWRRMTETQDGHIRARKFSSAHGPGPQVRAATRDFSSHVHFKECLRGWSEKGAKRQRVDTTTDGHAPRPAVTRPPPPAPRPALPPRVPNRRPGVENIVPLQDKVDGNQPIQPDMLMARIGSLKKVQHLPSKENVNCSNEPAVNLDNQVWKRLQARRGIVADEDEPTFHSRAQLLP